MKWSQKLYINGFKASKEDFEMLCERIREGVECVLKVTITRNKVYVTTV